MRIDLPKTPLQWRTAPDVDTALRSAVQKGLTAAMAVDYIRVQTGHAVTRNACIGRARRLGLRWKRGPHGQLKG